MTESYFVRPLDEELTETCFLHLILIFLDLIVDLSFMVQLNITINMLCLWATFIQGPLFQQRPYLSPGAVLRKNAGIASH